MVDLVKWLAEYPPSGPVKMHCRAQRKNPSKIVVKCAEYAEYHSYHGLWKANADGWVKA